MAIVILQKNPVPVDDIDATGTPSGSTFLRGDGAWASPVVSQAQAFFATGDLTVRQGKSPFPAPFAMTIQGVRAAVGTAPAGADVIVDVNVNGTTIFTTQANRPTIEAASTSSPEATPDVTSVVAGDLITVDIDQVGSSTPGADLVVVIRYIPA